MVDNTEEGCNPIPGHIESLWHRLHDITKRMAFIADGVQQVLCGSSGTGQQMNLQDHDMTNGLCSVILNFRRSLRSKLPPVARRQPPTKLDLTLKIKYFDD